MLTIKFRLMPTNNSQVTTTHFICNNHNHYPIIATINLVQRRDTTASPIHVMRDSEEYYIMTNANAEVGDRLKNNKMCSGFVPNLHLQLHLNLFFDFS